MHVLSHYTRYNTLELDLTNFLTKQENCLSTTSNHTFGLISLSSYGLFVVDIELIVLDLIHKSSFLSPSFMVLIKPLFTKEICKSCSLLYCVAFLSFFMQEIFCYLYHNWRISFEIYHKELMPMDQMNLVISCNLLCLKRRLSLPNIRSPN